MPVIYNFVPDEYVGRKVVLTESLQERDGVKTLTQRLSTKGLSPILAALSWSA